MNITQAIFIFASIFGPSNFSLLIYARLNVMSKESDNCINRRFWRSMWAQQTWFLSAAISFPAYLFCWVESGNYAVCTLNKTDTSWIGFDWKYELL